MLNGLKKDNFIFDCKIGVTFHEETEDPYVIYLQGCSHDKREWLHFYVFKTLEAACEALGRELPGIIAKRRTPLGSTDNCPPRGQEKA